MRIAVSTDDNNGLSSVVSPHFGRCPYFVLVDVEGREIAAVETVANPYYGNHRPGQVPGFIQGQGADVMLTGGMGRRAIQFFRQAGIQAATGATGSVRYALEQYLGGELSAAQPCRESLEHARHEDHEGRGDRGEYEQDEVGRLREEMEGLQQQLDQVTARLEKASSE